MTTQRNEKTYTLVVVTKSCDRVYIAYDKRKYYCLKKANELMELNNWYSYNVEVTDDEIIIRDIC